MSGTIPTLQALVTVIKDNGNYANFFVLGMAFGITPKQLHDYLMELEKLNLIDLSAVAEPQDYEQATLDEWAIPQISGGSLFFASIPDATENVPVEKVSQATRQKQTKKATVKEQTTEDKPMTSAIETLVISIETQANSTKPVYKTMQSLLKTIRDKHNVELGCQLNKAAKVLHEECKRIVTAFYSGTVQEKQASAPKATKTKAPTTHTSDKVDEPAPTSVPKEASTDLLLKEAQAEIEALRRQLADKTNEVAEYAEALQHANDTVKKQQQALDLQKQVITTLTANQAPATEPVVEQAAVVEPAVEVVAEVEADDEWEDDNSDAVDAMMVLLTDGKREVIAEAMKIVERKLGKDRMLSFQLALSDVEFLSYGEYAQAFRNLMTTYSVKMDWIEQAVDKVQA